MNFSNIQGLQGARNFFIKQLNFIDIIPPQNTASNSFVVEAESSFVCHSLFAQFLGTNGTTCSVADIDVLSSFNPNMSVIIQDTQSGKQLSNSPLAVANIFGLTQLPMFLPTPRLFPAKTQVTITLNNQSTRAYFAKLTFIGQKVYG